MEKTRIKVTTIDYFHRDHHMNVTCGLLPKKLNQNRKYFEDSSLILPHVNLNFDVPDSGAGEQKMESLFEYIRQNPFTNDTIPHFVTNKQLLKCIASSNYESFEVHVVQMNGVIYMLKGYEDFTINVSYGKIFEHFMTKTSENEEVENSGIVRKAVFMAEIPSGPQWKETPFRVFYSGEIDAIDENFQHYEFKSISEGTNDHFWKNRSCSYYWQCTLSNVPTMIVGSRTGKHPNDYKTRPPFSYPEYSLYEIKTLNVEEMPLEAAKAANKIENKLHKDEPLPRKPEWTVKECETKLRDFLIMVYRNVKAGQDCAVYSKRSIKDDWIVIAADKKTSEIYDFVETRIRKTATHATSTGLSSSHGHRETSEVTITNESGSKDNVKTQTNRVTSADKPPTSTAMKLNHNDTNSNRLEEKQALSLEKDLIATIPGMILTRPKTKLVINAPYDSLYPNRIQVINSTKNKIGFEVNFKSRNPEKLVVFPKFGVLDVDESITLEVGNESVPSDNNVSTTDRITIEWINLAEKEEFNPESKDIDGLFRKKTLFIEYND